MIQLANQVMSSEIKREALSGLRVYTYDANIPKEELSRYQPGKVIIHMDKVYVHEKKKPLNSSVRYMILSNYMKRVEDTEAEEHQGDFATFEKTYYKVLDVYQYGDKSLVVLLHLYIGEYWKTFNDKGLKYTEQLITDCRKLFEYSCDEGTAVEENTQTPNILIAYDENGIEYPLVVPMEENMHEPWRYKIRYFNHRLFYVQCPEDISWLYNELGAEAPTDGFIGYGFIDEERGKAFCILALAEISDGMVQIKELLNDGYVVAGTTAFKKSKAVSVNYLQQMGVFDEDIAYIKENIDVPSEMRIKLRGISSLDQNRHPLFPDDVFVRLSSKKFGTENVLVRTTELLEDDRIFGVLLEEPKGNYGIHEGDIIELLPMWLQGAWHCVTTTMALDLAAEMTAKGNKKTSEKKAEKSISKPKRKKSEMIYLSVVFPNSDKTYYYQTEDESIKVGDYVEVAVGYEEKVLAVKVVNIEFFTKKNAPLAPEKVKMILGKKSEEEQE